MSTTNPVVKELYLEFRNKSRAFNNNFPASIQSFETLPTLVLLKELYPQIIVKNWSSIAEKCNLSLLQASLTHSKMAEFQKQFNALLDCSAALNVELKKGKPVLKIRNWSKLKSDATVELLASGISQEKIDEAIKFVEAYKPSKIDDTSFKNYQQIANFIDELASKRLVNSMYNYFAKLVASFNITYSETVTVERKKILTFISSSNDELFTRHESIRVALANNDFETARINALNLASYIENSLLDKAVSYSASLASVRISGEGDFEKDGQLSMAIGQLLREIIYSVALAKWIAWTANWNASLALPKTWSKYAAKLKIYSSASYPVTPIASINSDPTKFDGKFINVQGEIGEVTILHLKRKAISSANIKDASGNSINIVIPYIKFDSTGITPGSYAQVCGVFQSTNKELNGGAALSMDLISLSEESKTDWLSWTKLQLRGIYTEIPHYINTQFSWQPGSDGAINPIKYNTLSQH
jgi:hypothetical protein